MSSVLTTVYIPSHIDVGVFRQKLREKSIIIYEGKGCFKNRVFQVGNIGELSIDDIRFFLHSLQEVLQSFDVVETKRIVAVNDHNPMFSSIENIFVSVPLIVKGRGK
jgi:2-aminoethylphosphonate-pyruvate transaminase